MSNEPDLSDFEKDEPRRFGLDLFIIHPSLRPEEITAALDLKPAFIHCVDTPRTTPQGKALAGKYPDTRWRYCVRHQVETQHFIEGLTAFVDRLTVHRAFLRGLAATGGRAMVILNFLGDGYFGDVIPKELLAKLVDLDLSLGIECFMVPQS